MATCYGKVERQRWVNDKMCHHCMASSGEIGKDPHERKVLLKERGFGYANTSLGLQFFCPNCIQGKDIVDWKDITWPI